METERGRGRPTSALARIRRDSSLEVGSSQSQARSRLALNLSLSPRRSVSAGQREAEKDLRPVKETDVTDDPASLSDQSKMNNFRKLWEESGRHSEVLKLQLCEKRAELESVRGQLESLAIQAVNHAAASQTEKIEKLTVIQKLEETQRELQILSYMEMLAEKTLYQLQWENDLLKEENETLIKVLAKIKK